MTQTASLNLEEITNNYNAWNNLTVVKLRSSLTFLNVTLLHIVRICLNVCKQMTDVKLLLLHRNSHNNLQFKWKKGVTNIKRIIITKGEKKDQNQHLNPGIQPTPHSQGGDNRLLCREGRRVCPCSPEVLQMPKVLTPQESL